MIVYIIAMIAILAVAAAVVGVVMVGIEGRGRARIPRAAAKVSEAARHLNGDVAAPSNTTHGDEEHRGRTLAGR